MTDRVAPGVDAGVTEPMIHDLVHGFYAKARVDPALGPIFDRVVVGNWDVHLEKMCAFWSSVMLMTGRFNGSPMIAQSLQLGVAASRAELPPTASVVFERP